MASAYCTQSDLYAFGVQRGALANPSRLIHEIAADADAFTLDVHGFDLNDQVIFRVQTGGTVPDPIVEGATYYAIPVDEYTFQVSATPDGAAIDLTSAGERVQVLAPMPVASAIEWASHIVEDMLPASVVPLEEPYPPLVVATTAELAAHKLLTRTGSASKVMGEMIDDAQKRLTRWGKGVPVRGEGEQPPANLAASSKAIQSTRASAWDRYGGT